MTNEWARFMVDIIVLLHLSFVLFVLAGALLLLKWPRLVWLHVPAVCWGILVELNGWLCPLTPLEARLREQAGLNMYHGDFVMHYLTPVLYPPGLTRTTQLAFGLIVIAVNLAIYSRVVRRWRSRHSQLRG